MDSPLVFRALLDLPVEWVKLNALVALMAILVSMELLHVFNALLVLSNTNTLLVRFATLTLCSRCPMISTMCA
jgi:tetrahydromethanopterin S-methyltransferase subunit C